MSMESLVLLLIGYGVMYVLPRLFFRRDQERRFHGRWWLVAAPFGMAPLAAILRFTGVLPGVWDGAAQPALAVLGVALVTAAIALVAATVASHRVPPSLWQQEDDKPRQLVTHGPYSVVRHPFYVAFVLLLAGTWLFAGDWLSLFALILGTSALVATARREERRILASDLAEEYAAYRARTGGFVPRLRGA